MENAEALAVLDRVEKQLRELRAILKDEDRPEVEVSGVGPFTHEGEEEHGLTYTWPFKENGEHKTQDDTYRRLQRFKDPSDRRFAVGIAEPFRFYGRERVYAVVHSVTKTDKLSALVVFVAADDYEDSKELLSIIKGKGPGGRQMFRPGDSLPAAYDGAVKSGYVVPFVSRVTGPHARHGLALVAPEDKPERMLMHAEVQRQLRRS